MYEEVSDDFYILQAERKVKQTFLKEEILDIGYDIELFTAFMDSRRGINIDLWTFGEIQEVVQEFKSKFTIEDTLESVLERSEKQEEAELTTDSNLNFTFSEMKSEDEPNPISNAEVIRHQQESDLISSFTEEHIEVNQSRQSIRISRRSTNFFGDELDQASSCPFEEAKDHELTSQGSDGNMINSIPSPDLSSKISSPSESTSDFTLPDDFEYKYNNSRDKLYTKAGTNLPETALSTAPNLSIRVTKHEIVQTGLLSSNYVAYFVYTKPMNWFVKRRFSDFIWLREVLAKLFPSYCLPPSPPKKATGRLQEATIIKRQRYLQRFIDSLCRLHLLLRCNVVVEFFKEENEKNFQKLKDKASKLVGPSKLIHYPSPDGTLICDPKHDSAYLPKVRDYLAASEGLEKKLKRDSEKLMEKLREASEALHTYSETLKQLTAVQDMIPNNQANKELYRTISSSIDTWSKFDDKRIGYLNEHFNMFFKFKYTGVEPFKELILARDVRFTNFIKAESRLKERKAKLWQQGDPSKWGIDDSKVDTAALRSSKEYAYSKMLHNETHAVNMLKDEFAYFNFQVHCELERVLTDNSILENRHFRRWANKMSDHARKESDYWLGLEKLLKEFEINLLPEKSYMKRLDEV